MKRALRGLPLLLLGAVVTVASGGAAAARYCWQLVHPPRYAEDPGARFATFQPPTLLYGRGYGDDQHQERLTHFEAAQVLAVNEWWKKDEVFWKEYADAHMARYRDVHGRHGAFPLDHPSVADGDNSQGGPDVVPPAGRCPFTQMLAASHLEADSTIVPPPWHHPVRPQAG